MASADKSELMRTVATTQFQGIRIRFVALLIDTIILSLLIGVVGSIFGSQTAGWAFGLFSFFIFLTYFTYLEGSTGQTVGKMLMKIKVIRAGWRKSRYETGIHQEYPPRYRWPISLFDRSHPNMEI